MADEPELEVEVLPEEEAKPETPAIYYPWVDNFDEYRRCWIYEYLANSDIEGKVLVQNMAMVEAFLKTGAVPAEEKPRSKLKVVSDGS